jgi:hypothetical protein
MAKKRLRRRSSNDAARINVLRPNADATGWVVVRHVFLAEALSRIARREWRALWYENGALAGVELTPPDTGRRSELVHIRCGSVECRKGWILGARLNLAKHREKRTEPEPLKQRIDFFDTDLTTKTRRVSAELAMKKIALQQWKAIWYEGGELAGVAAA